MSLLYLWHSIDSLVYCSNYSSDNGQVYRIQRYGSWGNPAMIHHNHIPGSTLVVGQEARQDVQNSSDFSSAITWFVLSYSAMVRCNSIQMSLQFTGSNVHFTLTGKELLVTGTDRVRISALNLQRTSWRRKQERWQMSVSRTNVKFELWDSFSRNCRSSCQLTGTESEANLREPKNTLFWMGMSM